jgi:hypothetical protein
VTALANVVWPALYLESRLWSLWAIAAGLVVEWGVLRWAFGIKLDRALLVALAMNAASLLAGTFLIPLAGLAWEVFAGFTFYQVFNVGTFNPGAWVATLIAAVLIAAALEALVIRDIFKIPVNRRRLLWLFGANVVSVAIAFASLLFRPARP